MSTGWGCERAALHYVLVGAAYRRMPDFTGNSEPKGAVEAARRAARKPVLRRFYRSVETTKDGDGFCVQLDGKSVRSPAGHTLLAPSAALAEAIAAEWRAQDDVIDPATMPLTRLANSIIDGVTERADAVAAEIKKYLASDLICYRATLPQKLVELQAHHWDPIVTWMARTVGANFLVTNG